MTARPIALRFDRGTLLLEGLDRDATLPDCVWDERVGALRAPAYRYREIVARLVRGERAGGPTLDDRAREYTTLTLSHVADRVAFEHQRDALDAWIAAGHRGVIVLPTGAGKSFLAELAIAKLQRSTLVVVPTLDLLNQWCDVLARAFAIEIGMLGGGYHEIRELTVSTYDSAHLHMERIGARFGFIVFDECHHLPSPTYLCAAEHAIAPFRLGLTATPDRRDGREALLDARVGRCVYERTIRELAGEYLADYDVETVTVALDEDEAERYRVARERYREFVSASGIRMSAPDGWARFIALSSRSSEGREAFLAYREQKQIAIAPRAKIRVLERILREHARDRAIVFTHDNEAVHEISRAFLIPAITHETDVKERREILRRFNSGVYPAVVTSRVLNEGVDVPSANVAVIVSGTGSVREHVQRLGRILRRGEGKRATLYEVVTANTMEEHVSDRRREHDAYR